MVYWSGHTVTAERITPMTRNALDPGIQAYYRAASTERLVKMLNLGREAIATGKGATARTPVAVAFIESILASRGVKA